MPRTTLVQPSSADAWLPLQAASIAQVSEAETNAAAVARQEAIIGPIVT